MLIFFSIQSLIKTWMSNLLPGFSGVRVAFVF